MRRASYFLAGAVVIVEIAFAGGYGYHRDELYFLAAGHHLAWSYADQGPLTPLIARLASDLSPGSLTVLRIPSAFAMGATVLLTGLLARELGGSRRAEALAAGCAAVSVIFLFEGHLLSTSTFDLLDWALVTWLVVRAIRLDDWRLLPLAGLALGIGLLNKPLPAFLAAGLLAGVAISGPRRLLRSPWAWSGAAIALAVWSPWIAWQAAHSWPQIDVSRSIAAGNSTSSQPWWAVVPFQVLVVGPPLAFFWIAGLVRLFRERGLRDYRFFAWAWLALAVVFMATGGKPYYLSGFMPVLIGAGAAAVDAWVARGRLTARVALLTVLFAVSALAGVVISLPVVPAENADGVVAVNPDVGETIGWPALVRTVAGAYDDLPHRARAVIFTANYGEAGAVDRFGPALGLPGAFSGHNAFGYWGPPPDGAAPVLVVGFGRRYAQSHFRGCAEAAQIHDPEGIDNDENGAAVMSCASPRRPWSREWAALRHLG